MLAFQKLRQQQDDNKSLKLILVKQQQRKERQRNEITEIQSGLNHAGPRFNITVL
jgi:hypothetical protein